MGICENCGKHTTKLIPVVDGEKTRNCCEECHAQLGNTGTMSVDESLQSVKSSPETSTNEGTEASIPFKPGDQVGHYVVRRWLGGGGGGDVYLAEHIQLGHKVAIKALKERLFAKEADRKRFLREARIAANLESPHIARVVDFDEQNGVQYCVMEYVEGESLSQRIDREKGLPIDVACGFVRQAAVALSQVHDVGIVHRDVKPQNAIITPGGTIKLLDLGLAKYIITIMDDVKTMGITGTPRYMSPEQIREAPPKPAMDMYSLGMTFYHMVFGISPFAGEKTLISILDCQLRKPLEFPSELPTDCPRAIVDVIRKMTAKEPHDRYRDMREFIAELDKKVMGRDVSGLAGMESIRSFVRRSRRKVLVGTAALGLCITIPVVVLWLQRLWDAPWDSAIIPSDARVALFVSNVGRFWDDVDSQLVLVRDKEEAYGKLRDLLSDLRQGAKRDLQVDISRKSDLEDFGVKLDDSATVVFLGLSEEKPDLAFILPVDQRRFEKRMEELTPGKILVRYYQRYSIYTPNPDREDDPCYFYFKRKVVFCSNMGSAKTMISVINNSGRSLANNARFVETISGFEKQFPYFLYINKNYLMADVISELSDKDQASLLNACFMLTSDSILGIQFKEKGIEFGAKLFLNNPEALKALLRQPPLRFDAAEHIGAGSIAYLLISFRDPGAFWKGIQSVLEERSPTVAEKVYGALHELKKQYGMDVEREIIPYLGDSVVVTWVDFPSGGGRGAELESIPEVVIAFAIKDRNRWEKLLARVEELTIKEEEREPPPFPRKSGSDDARRDESPPGSEPRKEKKQREYEIFLVFSRIWKGHSIRCLFPTILEPRCAYVINQDGRMVVTLMDARPYMGSNAPAADAALSLGNGRTLAEHEKGKDGNTWVPAPKHICAEAEKGFLAEQSAFAKEVRVDQDGDGVGEYGLLGELDGELVLRNGSERRPRDSKETLCGTTKGREGPGYYDDGRSCRKVYLPTVGGWGDDRTLGGTASSSGRSMPAAADLQEKQFLLYVWPSEKKEEGKAMPIASYCLLDNYLVISQTPEAIISFLSTPSDKDPGVIASPEFVSVLESRPSTYGCMSLRHMLSKGLRSGSEDVRKEMKEISPYLQALDFLELTLFAGEEDFHGTIRIVQRPGAKR